MAGTKRGSNIHEAPCGASSMLEVCSVVHWQSSDPPGESLELELAC